MCVYFETEGEITLCTNPKKPIVWVSTLKSQNDCMNTGIEKVRNVFMPHLISCKQFVRRVDFSGHEHCPTFGIPPCFDLVDSWSKGLLIISLSLTIYLANLHLFAFLPAEKMVACTRFSLY